MAKVGRNEHLGDGGAADSRVGKLIGNELVQLLTHVLGDPFIAVGGHTCTIANVKLGLVFGLLPGAFLQAQPLTLYSEFAQIAPNGKVVAPETPREILSPAIVRNGFTSFQVVVNAPPGTEWWLFVGQNPEDAVTVTLYRERGDALEQVEVPRKSSGTEVLWMDVWTAGDAPVARIKIEPELQIDGDWVIYPMEGRVTEAKVPGEAAAEPLCALRESGSESGSAIAKLIRRNAAQDAALAAQLTKEQVQTLRASCDSPAPARWSEKYLAIRDYLFRLR